MPRRRPLHSSNTTADLETWHLSAPRRERERERERVSKPQASLCSAEVHGQRGGNILDECAAGRSSSRMPMQLGNAKVLEEDKINKWTKDLGAAGEQLGAGCASTLSCGRAQAAPEDYLADGQDGHAIVMDACEGPAFVEYKEDKEFGLHPGEMNDPAAKKKSILREKDVRRRNEVAKHG
ncbi:unnamed protein product [Effrenium voratum]|nr:unnamed protein product [Effrenium voratum]